LQARAICCTPQLYAIAFFKKVIVMRHKKSLFLTVALAAFAPLTLTSGVFANTNSGSKFYVCADAQAADLDQAAYEALTWVEVKSVGSFGETGSNTNILTYDTWDTRVAQKAKGITDAGNPTVECARIATDPGQIILRTQGDGLNALEYAFKIERNDKATPAGTPTTIYNRGLVTGPSRPNGRNEDFDLEVFTLALNQLEIVVAPT